MRKFLPLTILFSLGRPHEPLECENKEEGEASLNRRPTPDHHRECAAFLHGKAEAIQMNFGVITGRPSTGSSVRNHAHYSSTFALIKL